MVITPISRISILWTELPGYLSACLKALVTHYEIDLQVIRRGKGRRHPYDETLFRWIPNLYTLDIACSPKERWRALRDALRDHDPQLAVVCGWAHPEYRRAAWWLKRQGVLVVGTSDNTWLGTWKQRLGGIPARWLLRCMYDCLWVPGERASILARHLGFRGLSLWQGLYVGDYDTFAAVARQRFSSTTIPNSWPRRMLFTGRFVESKGVKQLVGAYRRYREHTLQPWELWCAGSGPLESLLNAEPGIKVLGFVQPDDYPNILQQVGLFVLPSLHDPWGVAIHEAAAAGLPLLCSSACGATVELLQDGFNGYIFEPGDVQELAELLGYCTSGEVDLRTMGLRSARLAERYTPATWAHYLAEAIYRRFNRSLVTREALASPGQAEGTV